MTKILFVCLGNICRSPMAEFIMKEIVEKEGRSDEFFIRSAATSSEELGNPVYPPAREVLYARGIDCSGKRAQKLKSSDYDEYDYIVGMDSSNMWNIRRILGSDPDKKVYKLLEIAGIDRDVADPWYTGNFSKTESDIVLGCNALLKLIDTNL